MLNGRYKLTRYACHGPSAVNPYTPKAIERYASKSQAERALRLALAEDGVWPDLFDTQTEEYL